MDFDNVLSMASQNQGLSSLPVSNNENNRAKYYIRLFLGQLLASVGPKHA